MPRRLTRGEKVWRLFGTAAYEFRKFIKKAYGYIYYWVYYLIYRRFVLSIQDLVPSYDRYSYSRLRRIRREPVEPLLVSDIPSPVTRSLEEVAVHDLAPPADSYIASIADLVATYLGDASPASDAYIANIADLVATIMSDTAPTSDAHVATVSDRLTPPAVETTSVTDIIEALAPSLAGVVAEDVAAAADSYNILTSMLQPISTSDTSAVLDELASTISHVYRPESPEAAKVLATTLADAKTLVTYRFEEAVRVRYIPVSEMPWPEDPTKLIWQYYILEEVLTEELSDFYRMNPSLIQTLDATVTVGAATLNGYLYGTGWEERGFEWGTVPGHYTEEWTETGVFSAGVFSHRVTGLTRGETYYFRAKARKGSEWWYGEEKSFTVPSELVIETTIVSVSLSTAVAAGATLETESEVVEAPALTPPAVAAGATLETESEVVSKSLIIT